MDDQARALLLSLSKIVHDEDKAVTIEEKIKAIIAIGHSLCCGMCIKLLRTNAFI
jgi:hypothetical protein